MEWRDGAALHQLESCGHAYVCYHSGDLTVPARPDLGIDMRQGPLGPGPKPGPNDDELMERSRVEWT